MKARMSGICRGDGKVYARVRLTTAVSSDRISAHGELADAIVPCGIYPLGDADDWALEMPIMDAPRLDIIIEQWNEQGSVQDSCTLCMDYAKAKWASRLNYRLRAAQCARLRDCEQGHTTDQYQPRILHRYEGDEGAVWRFQIAWQGDPFVRPDIRIRDGHGAPLDAKPIVFEEQLDGLGENVIFYSLALPENQRFFLVEATDPTGNVASGFCSVNPEFDEVCRNATRQYMKDASDDDEAYRRWLKQHRATAEDLASQRSERFDYEPRISIVVSGAKQDSDELRRTTGSIEAQSYEHWELADAESAQGDYIALIDAGDELEPDALHCYVQAINDALAAEPGSELERAVRNPLCAYDDRIEPHVDLLFCDEDSFDRDGEYGQPRFKTRLNLDRLYSHDCVGNLLMLRRACVDKIEATSSRYDLILRTLEQGGKIIHIPRVLFHRHLERSDVAAKSPRHLERSDVAAESPRHLERSGVAAKSPRHLERSDEVAESPRHLERSGVAAESKDLSTGHKDTDGDSSTSHPSYAPLGMTNVEALQAHFDRRSIAGVVEYGPLPGTYRMHYALPYPAPLVSVIIPNKDHIEELDDCVTSLLERATYPNIEIVVVENNSENQATFGYYDKLVAQNPNVKVPRWSGEFNFPAIVNFGVEHAQGDYLLILNNDTEVITPDFIEEMVGLLQRPEVGVVGAKLFFKDRLVQHAGMIVGVRDAVAHANQDFSDERLGYEDTAVLPGNFSSVTGACQMVRRDVFEQVGGYDESFAVGFNDADFCLRVHEAGYLITYTPYAELYHYEFTSRGREIADAAKLARWERERDAFKTRWKAIFDDGDPYLNPNLDRDSAYYALPEEWGSSRGILRCAQNDVIPQALR